MAKAQLVTRATTAGTNTENLNKGSALTHAEMDKNLIGLRDASFGIADDSSTVLQVTDDKTITIAGGTGITTALSGDTLTITAGGSGDITSVVAGDGLTGGATTGDATLNIGAGTGIDVAADAISVDVSDFMANGSDNRVVTATGTDAMNAEANLTFDGSTLAVTGNITATTSIANDAILIDDNKIKPSRSNDTMLLDSGSSNLLELGMTGQFSNYSTNPRWDNGVRRVFDEQNFDMTSQTTSASRKYLHTTLTNVKAQQDSDSSNSNMRWRNGYSILQVDTNGSILANTSPTYFTGHVSELDITNTAGSSNAGKLAGGVANYANIYLFGNQSQLDIDDARVYQARLFSEAESGQTINIANAISYFAQGVDHDGSGTHNTTQETAFYYQAGAATTKTLIDTDTDTALSNVGTLKKYRENIVSLTSSSTITVDCSLAPIFTVTLGTNTEFNISNLATGQTVTLVITQDGTGSRTATFGTSGSTAVKFAGGYTALSTGANDIDVVTIFNDGTNFIGNCAKDYS